VRSRVTSCVKVESVDSCLCADTTYTSTKFGHEEPVPGHEPNLRDLPPLRFLPAFPCQDRNICSSDVENKHLGKSTITVTY
jgi:hypothetical protein